MAGYAHALILCAWEQHGRDSLHLRTVDLMGNCVHSATHPLEHVQLGAFVPEIEAALEQDKAVAALGFGLPGTQRLGRLVTSDYAGLLGTEFAAYYRAALFHAGGAGKRRQCSRAGLLLPAGEAGRHGVLPVFSAPLWPGSRPCAGGPALLRRARPCRGDWPPFARHRLAGVFLGGLFARLPRCGGMRRGGRRFFGPGGNCAVRGSVGPRPPGTGAPPMRENAGGPPPRFTLAENFLEDYTAGVASQTLEALECALETEL